MNDLELEPVSEDDKVHQLYSTTLEIANYYDNIRNVDKTIEYSFKLCEEDENDTVGLTKIVFWSSCLKRYENIFKLMEMIRGNHIKIDKLKEIFTRENRMTLRNFLLSQYINIIKQKESYINIINQEQNEEKIIDIKASEYLELFYNLICSFDIYTIYDAIINEENIIELYKTKYNLL